MISPLERLLVGPALGALLLNDPVALLLEHVRASLQEQDAEYVLFKLGRIHFTAEYVGGRKKVAFQFFERQLGHSFKFPNDP